MLTILIKSSVVIMVLLAFYKLLLERESFFKTNRVYLLACLALACALPFVSLPEVVQNQGFVAQVLEPQRVTVEPVEQTPEKDFTESVYKDGFNEKSSDADQSVITKSPEVEESSAFQTVQRNELNGRQEVQQSDKGTSRPLSFWLMVIYAFVAGILLLKLLVEVTSTLWKVYRHDDKIEDEGSVIVNMEGPTAPCSFFKYIFINPAEYDYDTYEQILAHEKIHVTKRHSLDLLLAELAIAVLWFNPFAWVLRREIEKNIEYQTDSILVGASTEVKEHYQLNLVRIACDTKPLAITTNYNQSLIKQRILKMNNKKSNRSGYWKYAFAAPLVFGLLVLLNKPTEVYAGVGQSEPNKELSPLSPLSPLQPEEVRGNIERDENVVPLKDDCHALNKAVRAQDVAEVRRLLKSVGPDCVDPDPGYVETIQGKYTWRQMNPRTPLATAAREGSMEIAKLLVAAGAKVGFDAGDHGSPMTEASGEGHTALVTYFIENGGNVNETSDGQGSPLNAAARGGYIETAKLLLNEGAEINYKNDGQGSPLNGASRNGHLEMVKFLLTKGADIDAQNDGQGSALNAAARNGHDQVVSFLLKRGVKIDAQNDGQGSALNAAARNGHLSTIKLLLEAGADVNRQNDGQGSALNAAARNGHDKVVELLLNEGADVDRNNDGQGTALNAAARNGHLSTIELLLDKGADVNRQSDGQGSALNAAARNGKDKVVKLLIERGADMDRNNDGQGTPLNAAARNGIITTAKLLIENGADIDRQSDGQGSALNAAARNGHIEMVKFLLEEGASINRQNDGQGSALNAAARNGHLDVVKLLVEKGARVNQHNDGQGTALAAASRNRHRKVVQYLISVGADQ